MSWRGQGGRRAKGRRGDQDPETDNTAWLAELEREAASADHEDDWADTLRGRRTGGGGPPEPSGAGYPAAGPPETGVPTPGHQSYRSSAFEDAPPAGDSGWAGQDPRDAADDPGWAWRPPAADPYGGAPAGRPEADWSDPGTGGWQPADADTPTGAWSPATPDPGYAPAGPDPGYAPGGPDPGFAPGPDPAYPAASDPAYPDAPLAGREPSYPAGYPEAPPSEPPVGREPDYPALFGELYRRSTGQQDPIWEAPPPVEPLPETGAADPVTGSWPFEESTQSWEPSDRSFIWPSNELPSAPAEWEQPGPAPWDDPAPDPAPRPSPSAGRTGTGNGMPPQPPGAAGSPPDDWAAAIPTDVPAAERAADPASATRAWRTDDLEPGVPLGPRSAPPGGQLGPGTAVPPGGGAATRTSRLRGGLDPGTPVGPAAGAAGATEAWAGPGAFAGAAGTRGGYGAPAGATGTRPTGREAGFGYDIGVEAEADDDPGDIRRKGSFGRRPAGERQARAWPRIVAIVSWIVLVMVVCWFYVFPWLERVLPENF